MIDEKKNSANKTLTAPRLGLGVTLELRRTGGGGFTVFTEARLATRLGPGQKIIGLIGWLVWNCIDRVLFQE